LGSSTEFVGPNTASNAAGGIVEACCAITFFEELRLGYVEGKNLIVLRFTSGGQSERIPETAREVVAAVIPPSVGAADRLNRVV
jgi:hypothetical protein